MGRTRRKVIEEEPSSTEEDKESEEDDDDTKKDVNSSSEKKQYVAPASVKKVFITHKSIGETEWKNVMTVSLPHPKTKVEALLLMDFRTEVEIVPSNKFFIYEILSMVHEEELASWFIGDTVVSDGRLHVFTPLDPIFLILPALMSNTKAMPILDILSDYLPAKISRILANRIPSEQLELVSTKKVSGDIEAFVYSEDATLSWLEKKVKAATAYMTEKKINGSEASVSLNFTRTSSDSKNDTEYLRYACELVCNYVDDVLKNKLLTKLGLPTEVERSKRKNDEITAEEGRKKLKGADGSDVKPLEDYGSSGTDSSAKKVAKDSAKQKELKKAAQGTHSLFKFFSAKPK